MRSEGLYCAVCANERTKAKLERDYASGAKQRPAPRWAVMSTTTDLKCYLGHAKVRTPKGVLYCRPCANGAKRAKAKGCSHFRDADYDYVVNDKGHDICLLCLARDANAA